MASTPESRAGWDYLTAGSDKVADKGKRVPIICTEAGANVLCLDLRGFGRSGGSWNIQSYRNTFMEDTRAALREAATQTGGRVVFFGHSLGGLIGAALACDAAPPAEVSAYILSAPTVDYSVDCVSKGVVKLLACCCPGFAPKSMAVLGPEGCTNNKQFAEEFQAVSPSMPFPARYLLAGMDIIDATKAR